MGGNMRTSTGLSRRDFIKYSGMGVAGVIAPKENSTQKNQPDIYARAAKIIISKGDMKERDIKYKDGTISTFEHRFKPKKEDKYDYTIHKSVDNSNSSTLREEIWGGITLPTWPPSSEDIEIERIYFFADLADGELDRFDVGYRVNGTLDVKSYGKSSYSEEYRTLFDLHKNMMQQTFDDSIKGLLNPNKEINLESILGKLKELYAISPER